MTPACEFEPVPDPEADGSVLLETDVEKAPEWEAETDYCVTVDAEGRRWLLSYTRGQRRCQRKKGECNLLRERQGPW